MMTETESPYRLPLNSRVYLRGDRTEVYTFARAGAEGWIRDHAQDPVGGYPLILIEWDKNHWGYNGQGNMWTFEDHFELIEEAMSEPNREDLAKALDVIGRALLGDDQVKSTAEPAVVEEPNEEKFIAATPEQYAEILRVANEKALSGEAFALVAIVKAESPYGDDKTVSVPRVFFAAKDEISHTLLGTQLASIGSIIHQNLAVDHINYLLDTQDGGDAQEDR